MVSVSNTHRNQKKKIENDKHFHGNKTLSREHNFQQILHGLIKKTNVNESLQVQIRLVINTKQTKTTRLTIHSIVGSSHAQRLQIVNINLEKFHIETWS